MVKAELSGPSRRAGSFLLSASSSHKARGGAGGWAAFQQELSALPHQNPKTSLRKPTFATEVAIESSHQNRAGWMLASCTHGSASDTKKTESTTFLGPGPRWPVPSKHTAAEGVDGVRVS